MIRDRGLLYGTVCAIVYILIKKKIDQVYRLTRRICSSNDSRQHHSWEIFKSVLQKICCMNTTDISRLTFKLSCLNFLDYFNQGQLKAVQAQLQGVNIAEQVTCSVGSRISVLSNLRAQPLLLSHLCRGDPASHQIMGILIYFLPSTNQREENPSGACSVPSSPGFPVWWEQESTNRVPG